MSRTTVFMIGGHAATRLPGILYGETDETSAPSYVESSRVPRRTWQDQIFHRNRASQPPRCALRPHPSRIPESRLASRWRAEAPH